MNYKMIIEGLLPVGVWITLLKEDLPELTTKDIHSSCEAMVKELKSAVSSSVSFSTTEGEVFAQAISFDTKAFVAYRASVLSV